MKDFNILDLKELSYLKTRLMEDGLTREDRTVLFEVLEEIENHVENFNLELDDELNFDFTFWTDGE